MNIIILGFFKYVAFFIGNINIITGSKFTIPKIILPLAISFFTFQQIAFLVDSYRKQVNKLDFLDYSIFISFFPQLIAGPIVRHHQIMPQIKSLKTKILNGQNIATGILLIAVGLIKKVILGDSLAVWANHGFDTLETLNFIKAWTTSLSYTFQIYFDFSGYVDIAIGSAYLFNIKLPFNFNSPYKALNIQDFWQRWHITLSNWLRDYLFLPIAYFTMRHIRNPRLYKIKVEVWGYSIAILLTMILGGIWHGAGWNFLVWGALHGIALMIHKLWSKTRIKFPKFVCWLLTFNFLNFTWVIFRANSFKEAYKVLKGMFSFAQFSLTEFHEFISIPVGFLSKYHIHFNSLPFALGDNFLAVFLIFCSFFIVLLLKNSNNVLSSEISPIKTSFWGSIVIFVSLVALFSEVSAEFIYFRF